MSHTIKDVAKKANVSIATVSRVLNGQGGYSIKTKEKVLSAIKELGYQPNALARGLINKRTKTIAILFPEVSSMFSAKILRGVENVVHEQGASVIVCNTASNGIRTMKYLQLLHEKRIEGIIFVSEVLKEEYYEAVSSMNIPIVLAATETYRYQLPYVKVNDRHAAYTAVEYLINKGHQKIGMISGNKYDPIAGHPRIEGYKEALRRNYITVNEKYIVDAKGFGFKDGFENLPRLLEAAPDITAVFAASDEMAVGVISAAYRLGIRIPDDLSVIGYDNLPLGEMSIPPLTTVAQPLEEIGEMAANMLFTMIETGETMESRIMPHKIIERASVKTLY
ncbi:LacI family DNA-binding transcriptional regulator [Geobacillus thermodenitrificans]|jgi:LacI family transcriptional regulator|uniref:LacI family DNA-binding transcriptional regulator n=1 Tax=Geobacillus thermodenitrificans TaxID=33940 RepID=UPI000C05ABA4|nr:substrate-binding domain-containing protein [Geobacillus thermodenitrificans]ATO37190.1 LacI family transcriptional regulator [Geobacillus thermodenitrificans]